MARIYRHQYATRDGNKRFSKKWYIAYTDANGIPHRIPGSKDKKAAQIMAGNIERREERIRCGIVDPHEPGTIRLADMEDEFETHLQAKGNTAQHVREVMGYLRRVAEAADWVLLSDMRAAGAEKYLLKRLKPEDEKQRALSYDGYNHYRAALMSFGNWLAKVRKVVMVNPFASLQRRNPELDRRHPRRTLTTKEFIDFLAAARKRPYRGMPGRDREILYLVAACSGLRVRALAALTPDRFKLAEDPPALYATASLQKNRKPHAIPLPGFLVDKLKPWLARRVGVLWPGDWSTWRSAEMVYADLRAAKLEPKTDAGWFDFHSLRHQYATMLVDSGATPAEVQLLLDHSSPTLTARYFKHLKTERLATPVERLPKLA